MLFENQNSQQITNFSNWLWQKAINQKYVQQGLNTKFIQQMKHGVLHPQVYGIFMIQDYQYQEQAAILFQMAYDLCQKNHQYQYMDLIEPFKTKYRKRADQHYKNWRLRKFTIDRSPACEQYVRVGKQNLQKYGGKYVFILQYACRKLWPDLANAIRHFIPIEQNAYRFWIQRYQYEEPQKKMSRIIDMLYQRGQLDKQLSWQLLQQCLICDINLLKEAFNEQFLRLKQKQSISNTSTKAQNEQCD